MIRHFPQRPWHFLPVGLGLVIGLVVGILALVAAVVSAGGGHGDYAAARALFPVPMLITLLEGDTIGPVSLTSAIIQFPLAGALAGYCRARSDWTLLFAAGLAHFLALIVAFSGVVPNFS